MELVLINVDKISDEDKIKAMETKEKISVTGNIDCMHFSDGAISKIYDKAEKFDNIEHILTEEQKEILENI